MTNRLCERFFGVSLAALYVSVCLPPCLSVCSFKSCYRLCILFVFARLCMPDLRLRFGCKHGRQVRHVEGRGWFLEQPHLSVTLDRWCVCLYTSMCQLSSACRSTGVYSSSLLLLGLTCFPVAPGPTNKARHGTRQKKSATRLGLGHPVLAFVQKLSLFMLLLQNFNIHFFAAVCASRNMLTVHCFTELNYWEVGFILSGIKTEKIPIKCSGWRLLCKWDHQFMNYTY